MHKNTRGSLWKNVLKSDNGCWCWTGHTDGVYGAIRFQGRTWKAHRLAWFLTSGPIPDKIFVCHRCDVPTCCRPDHLFLGTGFDNMADASAKGRLAVGERNGHAKLTAAEVEQIRDFVSHDYSFLEVGRAWGISKSAVDHVASRRRWKHIQ